MFHSNPLRRVAAKGSPLIADGHEVGPIKVTLSLVACHGDQAMCNSGALEEVQHTSSTLLSDRYGLSFSTHNTSPFVHVSFEVTDGHESEVAHPMGISVAASSVGMQESKSNSALEEQKEPQVPIGLIRSHARLPARSSCSTGEWEYKMHITAANHRTNARVVKSYTRAYMDAPQLKHCWAQS